MIEIPWFGVLHEYIHNILIIIKQTGFDFYDIFMIERT